MKLLLVRHGEGSASLRRVVGGHRGCVGLSTRGIKQVSRLASTLETIEINLGSVLTSGLRRAKETGSILAGRLGLEMELPTCEICELHPGAFDGVSFADMPASIDPYSDRSMPFLPGAESVDQLDQRVGSALLKTVSSGSCAIGTDPPVGVWVTHLGTIRSILERDSQHSGDLTSDLGTAAAVLIMVRLSGGVATTELISVVSSGEMARPS